MQLFGQHLTCADVVGLLSRAAAEQPSSHGYLDEPRHAVAEVRWANREVPRRGRRQTGVTRGPLLWFAVVSEDVSRPEVQWKGEPTFIQRTGIKRDLGLFDDPDAFYTQQGSPVAVRQRVPASDEPARERAPERRGCVVLISC